MTIIATGIATGIPDNPVRDPELQAHLESFLELPARPPHTMNFYQLDGYLRAICLCPADTSLRDCLPLVFNDQPPGFRDIAEAAQIETHLSALFEFHRQQIIAGRCDLPFTSRYTLDRTERIESEQWARGFLQGYISCEQNWNQTLSTMSEEEADKLGTQLDDVLTVVSAVADVDLAVFQGADPDSLDTLFAQFADTLIRFAGTTRKSLNVDLTGMDA